MREPLFDLLFTSPEARAVVAIAAIAARTTVAVTILVPAAHHRRRAAFELVDADGEETDNVLVDV
jgi:mRNA-degrading endonuclease toxin of MazEF toxin-antitoxin module